MTNDEFQSAYHEFATDSIHHAEAEAESITLEDGRHPAVVGLPFGQTIRYCLMLPSAAAFFTNLYPEAARSAAPTTEAAPFGSVGE